MLFQFKLFAILYLKSIFNYGSTGMKWSLRHVIFLVVFPLFYIGLQLINRICFLLDDLFFYEYRGIEVKSPVFILGFPRSGTTHLHRLFAKDEENTSLLLWEMMFAPSIVQKKFFLWFGRFDRKIGQPFYRFFIAVEEKQFAEARKMHHISHFEPEEDEIALIHIFASAFQMFMFPFDETLKYTHFDTALPERYRAKVMTFYKDLIRRHLHVFGPTKRYVSKNPAFSCKINSLYAAFPDAKIICMVRTPFEAVPSAVSWMSYNVNTFHISENRYHTERIIDGIAHWYKYPVEQLMKYPESSQSIETYDKLVSQPKAVVEGFYKRFGFSVSDAFQKKLENADQNAKSYKSRHLYSLEDMGLSRERILTRFSDTFDRFGFERGDDNKMKSFEKPTSSDMAG